MNHGDLLNGAIYTLQDEERKHLLEVMHTSEDGYVLFFDGNKERFITFEGLVAYFRRLRHLYNLEFD